MAVGVRLVEGPAHGLELVIPGDLMNPPQTYEILHSSLAHGTRRLAYVREINLDDSGPLWFYRYTGESVA